MTPLMNDYSSPLRTALSLQSQGKDMSRLGGAGVWANYVRAMCASAMPADPEALTAKHKFLITELESISGLSKNEKNSLTSAKSVIKNAIVRGLDVWQRDDDGNIKKDAEGHPLPRGKSDLQDDKDPVELLMAALDKAKAIAESEEFPIVDDGVKTSVSVKMKEILDALKMM